MTDLVQMSVEQMRAKGISHNKMKEQNEEDRTIWKNRVILKTSEDCIEIRDPKYERVNSVISYQGAEDDVRKVLGATIHNSKVCSETERIFNNKLTAHELRELAKVLEMAVTDTIRFVEKGVIKKIWEYIIFHTNINW